MKSDEHDDAERVEQEFRIIELQGQARELAGGEVTSWTSPDCPPEMAEQFWEQVVAFERAPDTTHFDRLLKAGVDLPPPGNLTDAQITAKLLEIAERLAEARVYLTNTDHLSDRELYTELWKDTLREWTPDLPPEVEMNCHIDLIGSGSEEDIYLWMKYYADEDTRNDWQQRYPDEEIPPHEDPPYDRDRFLPSPFYGFEEPQDPSLN